MSRSDKELQSIRSDYLDLLQDVLDAKDLMLSAGVERDSFANMFKEYATRHASAEPTKTKAAGEISLTSRQE